MSEFVQAFRDRVNTTTREPGIASPPLHSVADMSADGVPIRVYRPSEETLPLLCYIHGAGFVAGDLDSHDQICRLLATRIPAVVVACDYRLAPEHPFPAAVDDAIAAVDWTVAHASELGANPRRWALAGDSAGGTLAAVVAQQWAGRPDGPLMQALCCPSLESADLNLPSHLEFAETEGFNTAMMRQMRGHYLGDADPTDPKISPARTASLEGVAPAVIVTAELDPLRDDGEAYARRLVETGIPVTSYRQLAMVHYGVLWCRAAPAVASGIDVIVSALRSTLHGQESASP